MKRRYKPSVFRDMYEQPYSDVGVTRMKLYKSSKNSLGMVQRLDLLKRLPVHNGCVNSISWNETGDYILSGSDDQHIVITHGFNYKVLTKFKTSHRANIFSAKFLPGQGDRHIVSCSGDGIILFTDLNRPQSASPNQFSCHLGTTYDVVVVPNDSHSFLSCGEDGTVRWFDLRVKDKCRKGSCKDDILITCERAVTSLSLNPTTPYQLAVGCSDSRVRLFDRRMLGTVAAGYVETARTCRPLCTFTVPALKERSCRITSLNFSPDGEEILVSFSSDLLYLFSMRDRSGGDDPAAATEDDSDADGPSSERSPAPVRRLRLRGDWSDTGPHARPERDGGAGGAGEFVQTRRTLHSSLMQRMTDVLSRMLNDPATRANLNGGRGAQIPRPQDELEDVVSAETPRRPESPRSPVFPFEHPLNDSFSVNPFLPLDSPLSPDPEPGRDTPMLLGDAPGDAPGIRTTPNADHPDSGDVSADQTPALPMSLEDAAGPPGETPVTPTGGYCPIALRNAARSSTPSEPCVCDERTLSTMSPCEDLPLSTTTATTTVDNELPAPSAVHDSSRPDQSMPSNSLDIAQCSENSLDIAQCFENSLDVARHPENSLDVARHPENSLDIVRHTENSLDIAQHSEKGLDIAQHSENSLDITQSSENSLDIAQHSTNSLDVARHPENISDTTQHSEDGLDIAQHSENSIDVAQHSVPLSETPSADLDPSHGLVGTKELDRDAEQDVPAAATTVNMSIELVASPPTEGEGEAPSPPRFTIGDPRAKMQLVDPSLDDNFRRDSPLSPPPLTAMESVATQATGRTIEVREEDEVVVEEEEDSGGSDDSDNSDAQQFPRVMYPRPRRVMIPPGDIAQLRSNEDLIDTLHSMRHRHATEPAVLLSVADVTETGAAFAVRLAAETERGPPDIPFLPQRRASREELERGLRGRSPDVEEDSPGENSPDAHAHGADEGGEEEEEDSTPRHRTIHPIEREMDEAIAGVRRSAGLVSEERLPSSSFQPTVRRVFSGHRNARTMIKEACFWGTDYVMSGSDCGHVFVWERTSGRLVQLLEGDDHVVNCLQPHPTLPVLATSGIDYDVKLWAPLAADTTFDTALADMLKKRNEIMLEETKDTITVPATFMIRMLACLNQIRRGGRRNRRADDESNE